MEYSFSSLSKAKIFDQKESSNIFMHFFKLTKNYRLQKNVELDELSEALIDHSYLVMNNHPRYKGKTVFFIGNVVETNKNNLLDYIRKAIKKITGLILYLLFLLPIIIIRIISLPHKKILYLQ